MAIAEVGSAGPRAELAPAPDELAGDVGGRRIIAVPSDRAAPPLTLRAAGRWAPGWQIGALIAGYPVWWALGVTPFIFPLLALPLALQLWRCGHVRVPPGFWLWALFLIWVLGSALALDVTATGTVPPSGAGRYVAYSLRLLNYLAVTVMMLYIGNTSEQTLSRARVIRWFSYLCLATIALGCVAIVYPYGSFQTPFSYVAPGTLSAGAGDAGVAALAQVQSVLGDAAPRPAAPFAFTNAWGNNLSLLLVWFVVGWYVIGDQRRKIAAVAVLLVGTIPIVYSLNRGVWIGLILSVVYVGIRMAMRGKVLTLLALFVALSVAGLVFALSPLKDLVTQRTEEGHSNDVRTSLASEAVSVGTSSPVFGYGSTRATLGSDASIAIGQSDDCPKCGNRNIGSTGQLWLVLIAQGVIGAALYIGFFLRTLWTFRRDHSTIGIAGLLVVGLSIMYGLFYTALIMPLAITFVSIGLLWRNADIRKRALAPDRRMAP